jgi:hypothetical protein
MKTAMQELIFHIAYMERRKYQDEQTQIVGGMNDCIMYDAIVIQNRIIEELTKEYSEYLEKEKEQIIDARLDGFVISGEGWNGEYPFEGKTYEEISLKIHNEEYYKITYEQSK